MVYESYGRNGNTGVAVGFDDGSKGATKTPEIDAEMQEIEKEIHVLLENLSSLADRLDRVMLPSNPTPVSKDSVPQVNMPHSQMYVWLNETRRRIVQANTLIFEIRQRLEL